MKGHRDRRGRSPLANSLDLAAARQWMADQGCPDFFTLLAQMHAATTQSQSESSIEPDPIGGNPSGCLVNQRKDLER